MAKAREENGEIRVYNTETPQGWEVLEGFDNYYTDENQNQINISTGINFNLAHILSDDDWINFGFYPYTQKDFDPHIQEIDNIVFDLDAQIYTAVVVDKTWPQTLTNLKAQKIVNLKSIYNHELSKTDWVVVRNTELGATTDQSVLDQRAALRTECAAKEAEINALTTKKSVALYNLPSFE